MGEEEIGYEEELLGISPKKIPLRAKDMRTLAGMGIRGIIIIGPHHMWGQGPRLYFRKVSRIYRKLTDINSPKSLALNIEVMTLSRMAEVLCLKEGFCIVLGTVEREDGHWFILFQTDVKNPINDAIRRLMEGLIKSLSEIEQPPDEAPEAVGRAIRELLERMEGGYRN